MKRQKGFSVVELLVVIVAIVGGIGWCMNAYKITQCDFDAPYKAEAIRAVGIFMPPVGAVVGYIDLGK